MASQALRLALCEGHDTLAGNGFYAPIPRNVSRSPGGPPFRPRPCRKSTGALSFHKSAISPRISTARSTTPPAGGGAGVGVRADVAAAAIDAASAAFPNARRIYLSPRGKAANAKKHKQPHRQTGRRAYSAGVSEGLDQRVIDARQIEGIPSGRLRSFRRRAQRR